MSTLGELLRVSRTEKRVSLEVLEDAIKINRKVLESLEQDRIDPELPPVYVRGFVVAYCRYVGINEQEALRLYDENQKEPGSVYEAQEGRSEERHVEPRKLLLLILVSLASAALLGYVGFVMFSTGPDSTDSPQPSAEDSLLSPSLPEEQIDQAPLPEIPDEQPGPHDESVPVPLPPEETPAVDLSPPPQSPSERPGTTEEELVEVSAPDLPTAVQVRLITKDKAWIEAVIDNNHPIDKIYPPGDSVTWEAADKIDLRLGNAGGVALVVNEIPMRPFGRPKQVIRLTFTNETVSIDQGPPQSLESWKAQE